MQQLFAESSVFLQNDRKAASTAPRSTSALLAGPKSSAPPPSHPPLRHKVASRPVIPVGSRREPGERVFYGDAIVDAVDTAPPPDLPHLDNAESSESFVDINITDGDLLPTTQRPNTPPVAAAAPTHSTPRVPPNTPNTDAPNTASPSKKPSSSKWSSFFWGKSKSSASSSKESVTSPPVVSPANMVSAQPMAKPIPVPVAASSRPDSGAGGNDGVDSDEELEDTPMNRAYLERKERERRLAEEEEERLLRGRGGGGSTGDEVLDEWLAGGGDKRAGGARRRPVPSGTSQRRPKVQSRPQGASSQISSDVPTDRHSGSAPPRSTTPTMPSAMPSQPPLRTTNSAPMSASYQDHSALFHAAAAQSAAKGRDARTQSIDTPQSVSSTPVGGPPGSSSTTSDRFRNRGSSVDVNDAGRGSDYAKPSTGAPSTQSNRPQPAVSKSAEPVSRPATASMDAALPDGWEEVVTDDGSRYFYHRVTRVSR